MKNIAMFAGAKARDLVLQHLNAPGNVFNLQSDAHTAFDNLKWGIEAQVENGKVLISKCHYANITHCALSGQVYLQEGSFG
jgi:hypothetical protein